MGSKVDEQVAGAVGDVQEIKENPGDAAPHGARQQAVPRGQQPAPAARVLVCLWADVQRPQEQPCACVLPSSTHPSSHFPLCCSNCKPVILSEAICALLCLDLYS